MTRKLLPKLIICFVASALALLFAEFVLWQFSAVTVGRVDPEAHRVSDNLLLWYEPLPGSGDYSPQGAREDRIYALEKPKDTYRIIVVGDSLAHGYCVAKNEPYAKRLESLLNATKDARVKFEVINLGVPGYNINQIIEWLKKTGLSFNPDMILYGYWFDDVTVSGRKTKQWSQAENRLSSHFDVADLEKKRNVFKGWLLHSQLYRHLLSFRETRRILKRSNFEQELESSRAYETLPEAVQGMHRSFKEAYEHGKFFQPRRYETYYQYYTIDPKFILWHRSMQDFANICKQGDRKCLLLMTSVFSRRPPRAPYDWDPLHDFTKSLFAFYEIPVLDVSHALHEASMSETVSCDTEHPNARGHEIIADELFEYLGRSLGEGI